MEIRAATSYARDVNDRVISRMFEIVAGTLIQRSSGPYSRLFTARFLELYTRAAELSAGAKTSVHRTMHPRPCPSFQALTLLAAVQRDFLPLFETIFQYRISYPYLNRESSILFLIFLRRLIRKLLFVIIRINN